MQPTGPRFDLRRIIWIAAFLGVVTGVLGWATWREVTSGAQQIEKLMTTRATSIADVMAESGRHSLDVYQRWEDEIAGRLMDNARWVALQDSASGVTSEQLERFAVAHRLFRINLFDAEGNRVATSHPHEEHHDGEPRHHPRDFIYPILEGRTKSLRIGFKEARYLPGRRFAVAVARPRGGAVVVNVMADSMLAVLERVSPGNLFRTLGAAHGVKYMAIQNEDGILAASPGVKELSDLSQEPALTALREENEYVTRELDSPRGPVYEVARLVRFPGGSPAVLRVGLDAEPLHDARADIRRRAFMRFGVFIITVILGTVLLMVWQRHALLQGEIRRVRTELEAREEEVRRTEKLAAMGALASGVAHEIRNPLNTIHMIAQQLGRDPAGTDEMRQQAGHMRAESERIEGIVQQFLEFARPRAPRFEPLDVGLAVRAAAEAQEAAYETDGIRLEVAVDRIPTELDHEFLVEIVENLLRNAREATPRGGRVAVMARRQRGAVEIIVEDTGPGIPDEERERIFDLYFTTKPGGSGLGLSLVARMASAMGGSVRLDHDYTNGARFLVRFPLKGVSA